MHRHSFKSSGTPAGLLMPALMLWLYQQFSLKDWVEYLELFGKPIRVGKFGAEATEEDKTKLLSALRNLSSDMAAAVPQSMNIELIWGKGQSSSDHQKLLEYSNKQISKLVLGQTMTTDDGSSMSQAKVHGEVKASILRSDATAIAQTINRQVVPLIVALNRGERQAYPKIVIEPEEKADMDMVMKAMDRGVKISAEAIRSKLGLPAPKDENDTPSRTGATEGMTTQSLSEVSKDEEMAAGEDEEVLDSVDYLVEESLESDGDAEILKDIEKLTNKATSLEDLAGKLEALDIKGEAPKKLQQAIALSHLVGQDEYKDNDE